MELTDLKTNEDLRYMLDLSGHGPVFLLKHSATCGRSAAAKSEFEDFAGSHDFPCFIVVVQDSRLLSDKIEVDVGVKHESPQVILFLNGSAVWNASGSGINARALSLVAEEFGVKED